MNSNQNFIQYLERRGVYARVVSTDHLEELGSEIRELHAKGLYPDDLFKQYSHYFNPRVPANFPGARSIIVAATPQPMLQTRFHWRGKVHSLCVPPTYFDNQRITSNVRRLLRDAFKPDSHRLVQARLPAKLLAVRSGLALYGKNNITYVPQLSSLHRLTAFLSDYRSPVDHWQEKRALPACSNCRLCMKACPTGAISDDRFQVHIERCLTYMNEKRSAEAFPDWVARSAHNCVIGCMRCQRACPYDKEAVSQSVHRGEFSEAETAYLLEGNYSGVRAKKIEAKLKRIGLDLTVFPRNLEVLLADSI
jgi:epoxyqueuosine reductase